MDIKVLGSGCEDCDRLFALTKACCEELHIQAAVEKVEDLVEIVMFGVMSVPALMIDGTVVISGMVPSKEKIKELLKTGMH